MAQPVERLFELSGQIAKEGVSLVPRVVPTDASFIQYQHYPKGDCISPSTKSRWFYHAHRPADREEGEHGHFHLFLPLSMFDGEEPLIIPPPKTPKGKKTASVVHFAALSFDTDGMPMSWFTVNYWVTLEYMMSATAIAQRLREFDVSDAPGDPLVNQWITAAVATFHDPIIELLEQRDRVLAEKNYHDKSVEITSRCDFDL